MALGRPAAIIFDLDGTLIDSSQGILEAVNFALARFGERLRKREELLPFVGSPLEEMFGAFTRVPVADIRPVFREHGTEIIAEKSILLPGAEDTLGAFSAAGLRLAIGTTKTSSHVSRIVERFGWKGVFGAVVCGDHAPVKPAPDIFLLAQNGLNAASEETLVVGDTVNDVLAARAADLQIATLESVFGDRSALARTPSDWHFHSHTTLREFVLARLNAGVK